MTEWNMQLKELLQSEKYISWYKRNCQYLYPNCFLLGIVPHAHQADGTSYPQNDKMSLIAIKDTKS
jgi:hypothetical protein